MQREKAVFLAEMAGVTPLSKATGPGGEVATAIAKALYPTDECEAWLICKTLWKGAGVYDSVH